MNKFTDKEKIKAITSLLENGSRLSEWQESSLLDSVEKVIKEEVSDLSSETITRLIKKAKNG